MLSRSCAIQTREAPSSSHTKQHRSPAKTKVNQNLNDECSSFFRISRLQALNNIRIFKIECTEHGIHSCLRKKQWVWLPACMSLMSNTTHRLISDNGGQMKHTKSLESEIQLSQSSLRRRQPFWIVIYVTYKSSTQFLWLQTSRPVLVGTKSVNSLGL